MLKGPQDGAQRTCKGSLLALKVLWLANCPNFLNQRLSDMRCSCKYAFRVLIVKVHGQVCSNTTFEDL